MQFWHAPAFQRRDSSGRFRRTVLHLHHARAGRECWTRRAVPCPDYKPDAPENNPPYTQWYVPVGYAHPGNIWAFGASGDRPLYGVVGAVIAATANGSRLSRARAPRTSARAGTTASITFPRCRRIWTSNSLPHRPSLGAVRDAERQSPKLLAGFRRDFPEAESDRQLRISAGSERSIDGGPARGRRTAARCLSSRRADTSPGSRMQVWSRCHGEDSRARGPGGGCGPIRPATP